MNVTERMTGRPTDPRTPRETAAYNLLEQLSIPFERVDHDPAMTIADCEEINRRLGVVMCKNLFLCNRQQTQFYLLMIPGEKPLRTKDLSQQLGVARLSFADERFLPELLGLEAGAVTVLGLMNDRTNRVQLVIDRPVTAQPWIGCHPCVNTSSLKLASADVLERLLPAVGHSPIFVDLPEAEP